MALNYSILFLNNFILKMKIIRTLAFITTLVIYSISCFAQDTTKPFYFPHRTGDMWEYLITDWPGFPPDTLQHFTIFDSTDSNGIIHIAQFGRAINPIEPSLFSDTTKYWIDTIKNGVYGNGIDSSLIYKLDANQGDIRVVYDHSKIGGSSFDLARVIEKKKEVVLGKETTIMKIWYYGGADITDTMGLDMGTVTIADGFGVIDRTVAETAIDVSILGAVINDTLYGDTTLVSINEKLTNLPSEIKLYQNYPNPFNPSTKIKYTIPVSTKHALFVELKVYDILGREITTLVNKEQQPGNYEVEFVANLGANNYSPLPSGIYFYQLSVGNYIQTKKMILLK